MSSFYNCHATHKAVCVYCGKDFYRTDEWIYRISPERYCCTWSCLSASRKQAAKSDPQSEPKPKKRHESRYLTEQEKNDIVTMYKLGVCAYDISRQTGRSLFAVQSAIRQRCGTYRRPGK